MIILPFVLRLIEPFEYPFLVFILDSYPRIGYFDFQSFRRALQHFQRNIHPPAIRSKLKGIGQKVHHNLAHLVFVKGHIQPFHRRKESKVHMFFFRKHQKRATDITYIRHNVSFRKSKVQTRHLILTEIKQLVHQIQQTQCIAVNHTQFVLPFFICRLLHHTLQRRDNQRQRSAQFIWLTSSFFLASRSIWRILNLLRSLRCTV